MNIQEEILKRVSGNGDGVSVTDLLFGIAEDVGTDIESVTATMWHLVEEGQLSYGTDARVREVYNPRELRNTYLNCLPRYLIGAALAPPPVPAPVTMNAIVVDHHDCDTFYVRLIFGARNVEIARQPIRVLGGAARELSEPGGKEARDMLKARPGMTVGSIVVLTSDRPAALTLPNDKYGDRLDAVVTYLAADGTPHDLVSDLIMEQWMAPWDGRGTQPKPPWPRTVA